MGRDDKWTKKQIKRYENRDAATYRSNRKTGLTPSAPKHGAERKAAAANLQSYRQFARKAKAQAKVDKRDNATIQSNIRRRVKSKDGWGAIGAVKGGPERKAKAAQLLGKRKAQSTKRTFQSVELARKLKSRGYKVTIARGGGGSTVHGTKMGKKGGSVSLTASAKGRKIIGSPTWAPTIHRNSGAGGKRGWGRVVGGKGPRTEAQRRASIANLKKGRASRMRKGK